MVTKNVKIWDTEWVTLYGADSSHRVSMPQANYLDAAAFRTITLRINLPGISGARLELQQSGKPDGPWPVVGQGLTGATTMMIVLSGEGGDRAFSRFLRWEIAPTASSWQACFRLQAFVQE